MHETRARRRSWLGPTKVGFTARWRWLVIEPEMGEDFANHARLGDRRDEAKFSVAFGTEKSVDVINPAQKACPRSALRRGGGSR